MSEQTTPTEKPGLVQPKPGDSVVEITRIADGHVEHRSIVTGQSERSVDRLVMGMMINLDHEHWYVNERTIPAEGAAS
jgi:hypothetical protein